MRETGQFMAKIIRDDWLKWQDQHPGPSKLIGDQFHAMVKSKGAQMARDWLARQVAQYTGHPLADVRAVVHGPGTEAQEQDAHRARLNREWQYQLKQLIQNVKQASEDEMLGLMRARLQIQGGDATTRALMDQFDREFHARQRYFAQKRGHKPYPYESTRHSTREALRIAIKTEVRRRIKAQRRAAEAGFMTIGGMISQLDSAIAGIKQYGAHGPDKAKLQEILRAINSSQATTGNLRGLLSAGAALQDAISMFGNWRVKQPQIIDALEKVRQYLAEAKASRPRNPISVGTF